MEKMSFWESLTISFQPRAYRKIVSQPFARSFRYLALFLVLLSAVLSLKYTLVLRQGMKQANEWINANLPGKISKMLPGEIKIENGQVSTSAKEPFVRQWDFGEEGRKEKFAFVIDTTGKIRTLDDYPYGLLLTGHKLIFKNARPGGTAEIKEQDLSEVKLFVLKRGDEEQGEIAVLTSEGKTFSVTYENIERWRKAISRLLPLLAAPFFIYYLIVKLVHLFFFSLTSLVINDLTKAGLNYENLLNIGIFALIPPITLSLLFQVAGETVPFVPLLYILVYLIFLIMGIKGSKMTGSVKMTESS